MDNELNRAVETYRRACNSVDELSREHNEARVTVDTLWRRLREAEKIRDGCAIGVLKATGANDPTLLSPLRPQENNDEA